MTLLGMTPKLHFQGTSIWGIVLISAKAKTQSDSSRSGKTLPFSAPLKAKIIPNLEPGTHCLCPLNSPRALSLCLSHSIQPLRLLMYLAECLQAFQTATNRSLSREQKATKH